MSMDTAPENNLPATGLRLSGDAAREIAALRTSYAACERQVAELTDHNTELLGVLETVRAACAAGQQAARNAIGRNSPDSARWAGEAAAYAVIAEIVKPVA